MKLNIQNHAALALLAVTIFCTTSCVRSGYGQPGGYGANAGYFAMDPATAEANRQNTNRVEQEARDMNHQERMRQAQATEMATRHAPSTVVNNHTSFWLW